MGAIDTRLVSAHQSLEKALSAIAGPFRRGVKNKVREVVSKDEYVIRIAEATRVKGKEDERLGLFVLTSQRVLQVSTFLWESNVESILLGQIVSVQCKTGLFSSTLYVSWAQNRIVVRLARSEAQCLCDLINKAIADAKAATQRTPISAADEIAKCASLYARGILSPQEYERAKAMLIGRPTSKVEETAGMIESLHALYREGALSESEFNMKKWDVLSRP